MHYRKIESQSSKDFIPAFYEQLNFKNCFLFFYASLKLLLLSLRKKVTAFVTLMSQYSHVIEFKITTNFLRQPTCSSENVPFRHGSNVIPLH